MRNIPPTWLSPALRPTLDEIEAYARVILDSECRPEWAMPECRREAEMHLWMTRSLRAKPRPINRRHAIQRETASRMLGAA